MRILTVSLACAFLMPLAARAQEAITTGGHAPAIPAPPAADQPPLGIENDLDSHDDRGPPLVGPCGNVVQSDANGAPKTSNQPHGQVWAGAGTGRSYDVGGVVCQPIGKNGQVTIAVDQGSWGNRRW